MAFPLFTSYEIQGVVILFEALIVTDRPHTMKSFAEYKSKQGQLMDGNSKKTSLQSIIDSNKKQCWSRPSSKNQSSYQKKFASNKAKNGMSPGLFTFGDEGEEKIDHLSKNLPYQRTTSMTTLNTSCQKSEHLVEQSMKKMFRNRQEEETQTNYSYKKSAMQSKNNSLKNSINQENLFIPITLPDSLHTQSQSLKKSIMQTLHKNQQTLEFLNSSTEIFIEKICRQFETIIERASILKNTIIKQIQQYKIDWYSNLKQAQEQYLKNSYQKLILLQSLEQNFDDGNFSPLLQNKNRKGESAKSALMDELDKVKDKLKKFDDVKDKQMRKMNHLQKDLELINKNFIIQKLAKLEDISCIDTPRSQSHDTSLRDFIDSLNA